MTPDALPVRNPDTVRAELLHANSIEGKSWRAIASLRPYLGIPPGTLCSIAKGAISIPEKFYPQLGLTLPIKVAPCPICNGVHVHTHDQQVYDPAVQIVKPLPQPRKKREPRNYPGKVFLF